MVDSGAHERPVWLVGMMGCGKSSVGPHVASLLGRPFVDTDRRIEGATGRTVAQIFAESGEAYFRALEREMIESLAATQAVVALGGGAIAQPGAAERLRALGTIVYLRTSPRVLLERIGDPTRRPLLAGLGPAERAARVESLLAERKDAYESAEIVVDTDGVPVKDVAARTAGLVRDLEGGA